MSQLVRLLPGCLLLLLASLPQPGWCQSPDQQPVRDEDTPEFKLQDLILKVRTSHYDPLLGQSAIPALKEAFANASDTLTKVNVANVLVMYGQKDDVYWSVLYKRAEEIVNSTAPYPLVFDENGKSIRGAISPEFVQWMKDNNLRKDEAVQEQLGVFPVELPLMAEIGDPRGLLILRRGLSSRNYGVRAMAARGLALLDDTDSIQEIIQAAKTAPAEVQAWIARPLLAFDDSNAREAAEGLITDKKFLEELKKEVREKGPRALW